MRLKIRTSEKVFLILGALLMMTSFVLIQGNISFGFLSKDNWGDPFQANYSSAKNLPGIARPQTLATPEPTPALSTEEQFKRMVAKIPVHKEAEVVMPTSTSTPIPHMVARSRVYEKESVYLLKPANQAILHHPPHSKAGYSVQFKFEVDPKEIPCSIEIYSSGHLVFTKNWDGNKNGSYTETILLPNLGLYEWKVKTSGNKGELRQFTIRK